MEDTLLIDAVERFVKGEMSPQEKIYFEDLRKNNAELDQAVVEQLFFLNELDNYGQTKHFKQQLYEVSAKLTHEGFITKAPVKVQGKVVQLWNRYKRTIAVAASIAGLVSIFIASIVSVNNKATNIKPLVEKLNQQDNKTRQLENKINLLAAASPVIIQPRLDATFRATGFLIDAGNNYIVTNAHVVSEAKNHLIIENNKGDQYTAKVVYVNKQNDLAILKVTDSNFKKLPLLPYSIKKTNADLGEQVFILGFPKAEIVYGEGYVSAKNGYKMDTLYCQLTTSANEGNSGSPVVTKNGELVGIITSTETNAAGVVFAIKSSNILSAVEEVKKMDDYSSIKISSSASLKGMDRVSQIKKMQDYVFMIKGN
ncbi:MAG: serine protease [Ferruginibacter sp.]